MQLKHLLEDEHYGERQPKRHTSTSPPSLPTFSPHVASPRTPLVPSTSGDDDDDDCIMVTPKPKKNISERYTYFEQESLSSSPTGTRSRHTEPRYSSISFNAETIPSGGQTDECHGLAQADGEVDGITGVTFEPDLLDELQAAVDHMDVIKPDPLQELEAASTLAQLSRIGVQQTFFKCSMCNKGFSKESDMIRHERSLHVCSSPGCGKRFHRLSSLMTHWRTHTAKRLVWKAGVEPTEKTSLSDQKQDQATGKLPDGKAGETLTETQSFIVPKLFTCSICKKSWAKESDYAFHERSHKYCCPYPVCQLMRFCQLSELKAHNATVHPEEPTQALRDFCEMKYAGTYVPLKDLINSPPPEWKIYSEPRISDNHFRAYLEVVTVWVDVWSNYDGETKDFYHNESRNPDCGKVVLSPQQRKRLELLLGGGSFRMSNICFMIGSPYRSFFKVERHKDTIHMFFLDDPSVNGPHPKLHKVVEEAKEEIRYNSDPSGYTLADLDWMASLFTSDG